MTEAREAHTGPRKTEEKLRSRKQMKRSLYSGSGIATTRHHGIQAFTGNSPLPESPNPSYGQDNKCGRQPGAGS